MKSFDKLALALAIIVTLEGAAFTRRFAYHLYFDHMPTGKFLMAVAGWIVATYGPILIAALFWRFAKRSSVPWILHILLLPSFYILLLAGSSLMLSTLNVSDFDDTLGAPIMPALLCAIAMVFLYFSALVVGQVFKGRGSANGS